MKQTTARISALADGKPKALSIQKHAMEHLNWTAGDKVDLQHSNGIVTISRGSSFLIKWGNVKKQCAAYIPCARWLDEVAKTETLVVVALRAEVVNDMIRIHLNEFLSEEEFYARRSSWKRKLTNAMQSKRQFQHTILRRATVSFCNQDTALYAELERKAAKHNLNVGDFIRHCLRLGTLEPEVITGKHKLDRGQLNKIRAEQGFWTVEELTARALPLSWNQAWLNGQLELGLSFNAMAKRYGFTEWEYRKAAKAQRHSRVVP
jgi:hypothetical protein